MIIPRCQLNDAKLPLIVEKVCGLQHLVALNEKQAHEIGSKTNIRFPLQ